MAPFTTQKSTESNQLERRPQQGQQAQDPAMKLLASQMRENQPRRVEVTEISDMNFPQANIPPETGTRVIQVPEIASDVYSRARPHIERCNQYYCYYYYYI